MAARPRKGCAVALGRGPSMHLGFPYLKRTWGKCLVVFALFGGVLVPNQGVPNYGTRHIGSI